MATDDPTVSARRARLRKWIDDHYEGNERAYANKTKQAQPHVHGLLNTKSFRERAAETVERKTPEMPRGYLTRPLEERPLMPKSTDMKRPDEMIETLELDILYLRAVLNAVLRSLVNATPNAAKDVLRQLKKTPGHTKHYLAQAIEEIEEAQKKAAQDELSSLRVATPGVVKRIAKQ